MKRTFLKILFLLALIFGISFTSFAQVDLIEKYLSPGATTTPQTPEEAEELKRQILKRFGLPPDTPLSIFDVLRGNASGGISPLGPRPLHDLEIVFNNASFRPGARVRAVLVTFSADLGTARIQWSVNGKATGPPINGGVSFEFQLGALGSTNTVSAAVTTSGGASRTISRTLYPSLVHFTWYAPSYTPAWYRGKALVASGSNVVIAAFPDFRIGKTSLDPATLIYTWSVDGRRMPINSGSGKGKRTFLLQLSPRDDNSYMVAVEVKDERERIITEESIEIQTTRPESLFYQRDALYGLYTARSAEQVSLESGKEAVIQFEPFFVPLATFRNLEYTWKVNNSSVANSYKKNRSLRITADSASSGTQQVLVSYQDPLDFLQTGSGRATIYVSNQ